MNPEQQIKAAIVVFPEQIAFASPELNNAGQLIALRANELVNYMQTIDPELNRVEATHLAAAVIQGLPKHFEYNPELLLELKAIAKDIREPRPNQS